MAEPNEPLVPADCDLRDFRFMPVEVERLRRSRAWLIAKRQPELGFYMINLWMTAWHEVPAGSLEDDDDVLADAAMCDPKKWDRIRDKVMRGWVKGDDGRLYHPVVCEKARESWDSKWDRPDRAEQRSAKARAAAKARWAAREHSGEQCSDDATGMPEACSQDAKSVPEQCSDDALTGKGQGRDREVKGYLEDTPNPAERGFDEGISGKGNPRSNGTNPRTNGTNPRAIAAEHVAEVPWAARCRSWGKGHRWDAMWGPPPDEPGCFAPREMAADAIAKRAATH